MSEPFEIQPDLSLHPPAWPDFACQGPGHCRMPVALCVLMEMALARLSWCMPTRMRVP